MDRRIISAIVALLMAAAVLPLSVFAKGPAQSPGRREDVSFYSDRMIAGAASGSAGSRDIPDLDFALNVPGGELEFDDSTGDHPWIVVEEGDRVYAKSGNAGAALSMAVLSTTVEAQAGEALRFDFKAWGEGNVIYWDSCQFYVNSRRVLYEGALDNDWETFTYIFEETGTYTLMWGYVKDDFGDPEGDYFALDNVSIGEPEPIEQIIATESLEIPVNRFAQIEWTVLPAEADAYNAVTFTSADPEIAYVDSAGTVHGMSEGVTEVTVASLVDPDVCAVCEVTVIDTGLSVVDFYGFVKYDFTGGFTDQWITFTDAAPQLVTPVAGASGLRSAAYAYGTVLGFTESGDFFTAPIDDLDDLTVFQQPFSEDLWITSLTFDYVNGCLFGICAGEYDYYIGAFDPNSGMILNLAYLDTDETFYGICADEAGVIYGITDMGNLYTIDPATGEITLKAETGVFCHYAQDICYDFNSGDIYWAQFLGDSNNYFYRVDKETGEVTNLGTICPEGAEVGGLFVIPEEEPGGSDDVPVSGILINPSEATIHIGDTASFRAAVTPFNASNRNIEWSVDNEDILLVDQNGTVIGLEAGTATVCVTTEDGGFTAYATVNVLPPLGDPVAAFCFEEQDEVDSWTFIDSDGDGFNWNWNIADGLYYYAYEGDGVIYSKSYDDDTYDPLYPDNWAVSPAVELGEGYAAVTLWYVGEDEHYASEHFMIYAGTTPDIESMEPVSPEYIATGSYQQAEADLSQFAGGTVYIAIRHFNCEDMYALNIDLVEFFNNTDYEPPVPDHLWGDADGDGEVTAADALLTMRFVMGLIPEEEICAGNINVNGDDEYSLVDALLIIRKVMGFIDLFPVEEV